MFLLKVVTRLTAPRLPPSPTCCKKIDINGERNTHILILLAGEREEKVILLSPF